jgi:hypothetical protein
VAEGLITPAEGESLGNIISGHVKGVEAADLARRVEELESQRGRNAALHPGTRSTRRKGIP